MIICPLSITLAIITSICMVLLLYGLSISHEVVTVLSTGILFLTIIFGWGIAGSVKTIKSNSIELKPSTIFKGKDFVIIELEDTVLISKDIKHYLADSLYVYKITDYNIYNCKWIRYSILKELIKDEQ